MNKQCIKCGSDSTKKWYSGPTCIKCYGSAHAKTYYENNKQKQIDKQKVYYQLNKEKCILKQKEYKKEKQKSPSGHPCKTCNREASSQWYEGPVCVTCYSKTRPKKVRPHPSNLPCINCGVLEHYRWYKGPTCHNCYQNTDKQKIKTLIINNKSKTKFSLKAKFKIGMRNAKIRNLPWTITIEEYSNLVNNPCYYCNFVFMGKEQGANLDRIDNQKGYEMENVLPCCGSCNIKRGANWTVDEFKVAVDAILAYRKQINLKIS